jgi:predicted RecB family nuclease
MRLVGGLVHLSATDLAGWLACRHLTGLELDAARGSRRRPARGENPALELLQERGLAHEREYVEWLAVNEVVTIADDGVRGAAEATAAAMRQGAGLIVQASLAAGRWFGRADLLRKVERPSRLGAWSYEVIDTKLAGETRARTILQLCLYSDLVGAIQGELPLEFHVVSPAPGASSPQPFATQSYRLADTMAYYRLVRRRLEAAAPERLDDAARFDTYPDPVEHCDVCDWWADCARRRRDDDSVWLVAGVTRPRRRELAAIGIDTLEGLARHDGGFAPERVSAESLLRVRDQARVQLAGRREARPVHEMLPVEPGRGLARLPEPSPGDLYFDIEGDRMGIAEGREFLFGLARASQILLANAFCRYFELAREVDLDFLPRAARLGPHSSRSGPSR